MTAPVLSVKETLCAEKGGRGQALPGWLWELIASSVCTFNGFKMAQNFQVNKSSKELQTSTNTYKYRNGEGQVTAVKTPSPADGLS